MKSWQPIETAPQDGTSVLICTTDDHGEIEMAVAWWGMDAYGSGWFMTDDSQFISPTHWMPLPPPPGTEHDQNGNVAGRVAGSSGRV